MKKRTSKAIFAETLIELARSIPMDRITITQLVQASGLSSKTFYNHFQDKAELMHYIDTMGIEVIFERLKAKELSPHDCMLAALRFYRAVRDFAQNAMKNTSGQGSYGEQHREYAIEAAMQFLKHRSGLREIPEDVAFALRMYINGLCPAFERHIFQDDGISDEEFVRLAEAAMPESVKPFYF